MQSRTDHNWIQTFTGRQYWPTAPRPEDVDIVDIAHHLSNICRYTGACREFYSVAQHCVLMSMIDWLPDELRLVALLHDAAEAHTGDFARPVKREIADMGRLDELNCWAVGQAFGVDLVNLPEEIHRADLVMLATERRDLMSTPPRPWVSTERIEPLGMVICPLPPRTAERLFLGRYEQLKERTAVLGAASCT